MEIKIHVGQELQPWRTLEFTFNPGRAIPENGIPIYSLITLKAR